MHFNMLKKVARKFLVQSFSFRKFQKFTALPIRPPHDVICPTLARRHAVGLPVDVRRVVIVLVAVAAVRHHHVVGHRHRRGRWRAHAWRNVAQRLRHRAA